MSRRSRIRRAAHGQPTAFASYSSTCADPLRCGLAGDHPEYGNGAIDTDVLFGEADLLARLMTNCVLEHFEIIAMALHPSCDRLRAAVTKGQHAGVATQDAALSTITLFVTARAG
jgi:hypothetical protein